MVLFNFFNFPYENGIRLPYKSRFYCRKNSIYVWTLRFPHFLYETRTRTIVFEVRCMFISRMCINVEGMKNKKSQNSCAQEGEGGWSSAWGGPTGRFRRLRWPSRPSSGRAKVSVEWWVTSDRDQRGSHHPRCISRPVKGKKNVV